MLLLSYMDLPKFHFSAVIVHVNTDGSTRIWWVELISAFVLMCWWLTGSSAPWRLCRGWRTPAAGWLDSSPLSDWGYIHCSRSKEPAPLPETKDPGGGGLTFLPLIWNCGTKFNLGWRITLWVTFWREWRVAFTWKWGLEIQAAICLKSGSWIRMNWDGSITSRISSISPRNITCTQTHASFFTTRHSHDTWWHMTQGIRNRLHCYAGLKDNDWRNISPLSACRFLASISAALWWSEQKTSITLMEINTADISSAGWLAIIHLTHLY